MSDTTARRVRQVKGIEDDGTVSVCRNIWHDDPRGTHMLVTVEEWERLRAENERLKAFIADKIHDATRERMLMEVDGE